MTRHARIKICFPVPLYRISRSCTKPSRVHIPRGSCNRALPLTIRYYYFDKVHKHRYSDGIFFIHNSGIRTWNTNNHVHARNDRDRFSRKGARFFRKIMLVPFVPSSVEIRTNILDIDY